MDLPMLYDGQIFANDAAAAYQPGSVYAWRGGTGRKEWALVKYVQLDNNGCSQGEALVTNYATLADHSVAKASTDDMYSRPFRGVAAATIASQKYGFMIYSGFVGTADLSMTVASGDFLCLSGSTAGKLTGLQASPHAVAVSRTAIATGLGSIQLIGTWG